MQKHFVTVFVGLAVVAAGLMALHTKPVIADTQSSSAVFDSSGKLKLPTGYRRWIFVGAPLTPNALNNGNASFPEYHHVYIEERKRGRLSEDGAFPGRERSSSKNSTRVLNPTFPDGSRTEPSGRGYFNGEYNGIDVTVKDSKRFAKTNGWGFFTFGHHPLPYAETAARIAHNRMWELPRNLRGEDGHDMGPVLSIASRQVSN